MTRKRTLEEVENLLRNFAPAEPGADVDTRILHAVELLEPAVPRRTPRPVALLAGLSALAAIVCFGVFLFTRGSSHPDSAVAPDTRSVAVIHEDLILTCVGLHRTSLTQMEEILEVVPEGREEERDAISAKLEQCLERLSELESRVRREPGSSYLEEPRKKEVHV